MADLEQSIQQVLDYLANVPRDESGDGWTMGEPIANGTGLTAADINDAVSLLAESGYARWLQALGTHPWRFTLVAITPQGRALQQKSHTDTPVAQNQAPVTVNIHAQNFSGVAAGAVSGQTSVVSHQNSAVFDTVAIRNAIDEIKKYKGDLGLASPSAQSLDDEIQVVDTELAASLPNQSKVRNALKSIKGIIEGGVKDGIKSVIAAGIIHVLAGLI
jgi:hypothetical protein